MTRSINSQDMIGAAVMDPQPCVSHSKWPAPWLHIYKVIFDDLKAIPTPTPLALNREMLRRADGNVADHQAPTRVESHACGSRVYTSNASQGAARSVRGEFKSTTDVHSTAKSSNSIPACRICVKLKPVTVDCPISTDTTLSTTVPRVAYRHDVDSPGG
jgi:hypothetical protein